MFSPSLVEQEITRRYYRNKANLFISSMGYAGPSFTLNYPYQFILGRTPSLNEVQPFLNALKHGASKKKVLKIILYSPESMSRNSNPPKAIYFSVSTLLSQSRKNFVPQLYAQILSRLPNEHELTLWQNRQKRFTRFGVLLLFLRVVEYRCNFKLLALSHTTFNIHFKSVKFLKKVKQVLKNRIATYSQKLQLQKTENV